MQSTIVSFQTIKERSEGLYKEKGSKFLAYAFPVQSEEDVQSALEELRSEHPKARHFCYAYRLGADGSAFRQNDDGEPSGTAGKPIYGQLLSHEVTDILIVVVRYFGGTKLGASGLITAYKTSADAALQNARIITKSIQCVYHMIVDYERLPMMLEAMKQAEVTIVDKIFEASANLTIAIPVDQIEQKWNYIATYFIGYDAQFQDLDDDAKITITELDQRAIA